jgi:hypothetical protein
MQNKYLGKLSEMMNTVRLLVKLAVLWGASVSAVSATDILFQSTDGGNRSASVYFQIVLSNLQITVTNTGTNPGGNFNDTYGIGGVFFDITGNPVLTPLSALIPNSANVANGAIASDFGKNVEYDEITGGYPNGASEGIRVVGYGLAGGTANFCSSGCNQVSGLDWSLIFNGYVNGSGNSSISGKPLVVYQEQFTLSGIGNVDLSQVVSNVRIQYGSTTAATFTTGTGVTPEPASYLMIGGGMMLLGLIRVRHSRQQ